MASRSPRVYLYLTYLRGVVTALWACALCAPLRSLLSGLRDPLSGVMFKLHHHDPNRGTVFTLYDCIRYDVYCCIHIRLYSTQ